MRAKRHDPAFRGRQTLAAIGLAVGVAVVAHLSALAQTAPLAPPGFDAVPRPPGSIGAPAQTLVAPGAAGSSLMTPGGSAGPLQLQAPPPPLQSALPPPVAQPAAVPPTTAAIPPSTVPMVPAGQVALMVNARFGRETPAINGGLHWRIYADKPDPNGAFRLLREERAAAPIFVLAPGGYVVYVSFGLASAVKRVQLRSETVRETFEIVAGGARFEGRVGDSKIPPSQITFDVYRGSQFEGGERRPLAQGIGTTDVVLLPEGSYNVVSNYGDSNAVVRSDIRVTAGKLTDVVINHRAAVITLKLVNERGGEALANTAWSVLTPGGDIVKEATGAFPKVVLSEGEYSVVARNEGKTFNGKFRVEPGFDREIEVMAR
jgi:hypothetical protein